MKFDKNVRPSIYYLGRATINSIPVAGPFLVEAYQALLPAPFEYKISAVLKSLETVSDATRNVALTSVIAPPSANTERGLKYVANLSNLLSNENLTHFAKLQLQLDLAVAHQKAGKTAKANSFLRMIKTSDLPEVDRHRFFLCASKLVSQSLNSPEYLRSFLSKVFVLDKSLSQDSSFLAPMYWRLALMYAKTHEKMAKYYLDMHRDAAGKSNYQVAHNEQCRALVNNDFLSILDGKTQKKHSNKFVSSIDRAFDVYLNCNDLWVKKKSLATNYLISAISLFKEHEIEEYFKYLCAARLLFSETNSDPREEAISEILRFIFPLNLWETKFVFCDNPLDELVKHPQSAIGIRVFFHIQSYDQ